MFPSDIPVLYHLTELGDTVIHQILLHIIWVAYNVPEEITNINLKLVVLGKFAQLTEALEFLNA